MGLDMYLEGEKVSRGAAKRVDGFSVKGETLEIGYWRKHAPLHRLIIETFKDGVDDCRPLWLDADDLRKIAHMLRAGEFPDNEACGGFFFGNEEWWDEQREEAEADADTFDKAAEWAEAGGETHWHSVMYKASW